MSLTVIKLHELYSLYNYANCSNVLQIVRIMKNLDSAVLVVVSFARSYNYLHQ